MSSIGRAVKLSVLKRTSFVPQCLSTPRNISTSEKKADTTVVGPTTTHSDHSTEQPKKKKYFYEYGFAGKTEEEEHNNMNVAMFTYITIGIVATGFMYAYRPDSLRDWARREGHLELRRREQLGLPLIDPNYIDPSQIYLPSDEELGDTEIII